ncbi:protein of unknown function [Formivibrio citricus]|uniref:DUF1841 domain-containing protein n=1 Tax=Formivibrio citricus TaxID=83765 RepID=A0A1I4WV23_9NEIS|nr:DUF1841 family protein [Formivibrio citricus]SFN17315.1 protein of unknown function [Formivibrio citricus]
MLFTPSRDEARRFFIAVWQKHQTGQPLADLERMTLAILLDHPEYHRYLVEDQVDHDWRPEHGETNPFLHIGMHLAIEEQLSIDQPPGIRPLYQALCQALADEHAARHEMMDGLAEMIWQAQRNRTAPDPAIYLEVLRKKAGPRQ